MCLIKESLEFSYLYIFVDVVSSKCQLYSLISVCSETACHSCIFPGTGDITPN